MLSDQELQSALVLNPPKFGQGDIARVVAATSLHGFEIGAVVGVGQIIQRRSDGSTWNYCTDAAGNNWGVDDSELELMMTAEEFEAKEAAKAAQVDKEETGDGEL
jgi:hypothetical protein